ncbi:MAG: MopE-related protein [Pseudomonadota bacterium]
MSRILLTFIIAHVLGLAGAAQARDRIEIVGSSTAYPLSESIGAELTRTTDSPMPNITSTGTGGGFKLFCAGVGAAYPDVIAGTRQIRPSERSACETNGVDLEPLSAAGDVSIGKVGDDEIFVYYKPVHVNVIPGLREYINLYRNGVNQARQNSGPLAAAGLAAPSAQETARLVTGAQAESRGVSMRKPWQPPIRESYVLRNRPDGSALRRWGDCNDNDAAVHPGQVEVCNGIDDNCNATIDDAANVQVYEDRDRDGFGDSARAMLVCLPGHPVDQISLRGGDCDDTDRLKTPISGCN